MVPLLFRFKQDLGGSYAQAGASMADTAMTNATNIYEQSQNREFNAEQANAQRSWEANQAGIQRGFANAQAVQQMDFQQKMLGQTEGFSQQMSDTQIQRRAQDLQRAGFNPLLSVSSLGGASSPSAAAPSGAMGSSGIPGGATASINSLPQMNSMLQAYNQTRLASAQQASDLADAGLKGNLARESGFRGDQLAVDTSDSLLMARSQAMMARYGMALDQANIVAQTRNLVVSETTGQDLANVNQQIKNNIDRLNPMGRAAFVDEMVQTQLAVMRQTQSEAGNIAAVQRGESSPYGKAATAIAYAQALHQPVSSAADIAGKFPTSSGSPGPRPSVNPFGNEPVPVLSDMP